MEVYILKSAVCLAILFSFYKLFLENESMHEFKRFYLLGALLLSFIIPLITFTTYIIAPEVNNTIFLTETSGTTINESVNIFPVALWILYGIGVVFFSLKFFRNLRNLHLKIKLNPKVRSHRIIKVLLEEVATPHTFFSYIFLNKEKYEKQQIPKEVLLHEETHALQKHSLDILFIEIIQILFWFNPIIYLMKRSIRLNHEFLADRAVLQEGIEPAPYQNLLLSYSSKMTDFDLANSFNYSSIKKRITLMKTQTSKRSIMLRGILILPLITLLLFGFSSTEEVIKNASPTVTPSEVLQKKATKAQVSEYNKLAKKYNAMPADNMFVQKKDVERLKYLYGLMSDEQKSNAQPFPKFPPMPAPPNAPKSPKSPKDSDKNTWVDNTNGEIPPPPTVSRQEPLDHIVSMADENAAFFYEGQRITSNQAIALIKKNKNLNIETQMFEKSNPIVKISKSGIVIEKNTWVDKNKSEVPPPPPPPGTPKAPKGDNENTYAPPPLNPPSPPAPLPAQDPAKVILEMAEKGASFYMDTKKIDANEAIELVRKNDNIKIEVQDSDSEKPIVRLIGC